MGVEIQVYKGDLQSATNLNLIQQLSKINIPLWLAITPAGLFQMIEADKEIYTSSLCPKFSESLSIWKRISLQLNFENLIIMEKAKLECLCLHEDARFYSSNNVKLKLHLKRNVMTSRVYLLIYTF